MLASLSLAFALASAPSAPSAPSAQSAPAKAPSLEGPARVFFSDLQPSAGATREQAKLISEALLVAARRHAERWDVIGAADLTTLLDVEANKQALGCDTISCASEIADALNAPQLVQGTLGKVGETWIVTLSRIERTSLAVVARSQAQAAGAAPDVLLPLLRACVAEVLGAPPDEEPALSPLLLVGAGTAGVGALALCAAGLLYLGARSEYDQGVAVQKRADGTLDELHAHRDAGQRYYVGAVVAAVAGGALVVGGTAVAVAGLVLGSGE